MAGEDDRPGPRANDDKTPADSNLSARLDRLESSLDKVVSRREVKHKAEAASEDQRQGIGQALRLSSEFIAGIIAGAGLGWVFDRLTGYSPWGLIVFLMLGFAAGLMNVLRAAGMLKGRPIGGKKP